MSHVKTALITGASAGIGLAFSELLASKGYELVLVARRLDRLEALASKLTAEHGIRCHCIAADLAQATAVTELLTQLTSKNLHIDFLINNAGFSSSTEFAASSWVDLHAEIQVMITALTQLMHGLAPAMLSNGSGYIINLASIAAFVPPLPSLLYTGVKSYVLNVSQALDIEFKPQGVHVTALCPGLTHTEFHAVQGSTAHTENIPEIAWQSAAEVALAGYQAVLKGQPVCVPGVVNKTMVGLSSKLPQRLRYLLAKQFKIT